MCTWSTKNSSCYRICAHACSVHMPQTAGLVALEQQVHQTVLSANSLPTEPRVECVHGWWHTKRSMLRASVVGKQRHAKLECGSWGIGHLHIHIQTTLAAPVMTDRTAGAQSVHQCNTVQYTHHNTTRQNTTQNKKYTPSQWEETPAKTGCAN